MIFLCNSKNHKTSCLHKICFKILYTFQKRQGSGNPRGRPPNNPQAHGLKTKKKKKHHKTVREVEEEDEPIILNAEKLEQCSIILAELNRKFFGTTFRV